MSHQKYLWACLLPFLAGAAAAQTQTGADMQHYEDVINGNYMSTQFDNRYEGTKGSPFLFEDWSEGKVVDTQGHEHKNLQMKYDAYSNKILVKYASRGPLYLNDNYAKAFYIKDPATAKWLKFVLAHDPENKQKAQYFQELSPGKTTLLEQTHIDLVKADFKGAYSQGRTYDEFQKSSIFYLKKENGDLTKLKTNRKGLVNSFPAHHDELKKYITGQRLRPDNPEDLARLVQYYNSL